MNIPEFPALRPSSIQQDLRRLGICVPTQLEVEGQEGEGIPGDAPGDTWRRDASDTISLETWVWVKIKAPGDRRF